MRRHCRVSGLYPAEGTAHRCFGYSHTQEEKVLRLRFGLMMAGRTLEEVGREFNVTRERIRQIEAKALRKLRHPSRSKKLKDFLIKKYDGSQGG